MRNALRLLTTPTAIVLIVAMAAALAIGLWRRHDLHIAAHRRLADCHIDRKLQEGQVTKGSTTVAVLGDGLADGYGLPGGPKQAWPALVGTQRHWTTMVNGVADSGYVAGGYCGHQRFSYRLAQVLALHPSVVIVEGGTGDIASSTKKDFRDRFVKAARHVLGQLKTVPHVVVVGPLPTSSTPSAEEQLVDTALSKIAATKGETYVSALQWRLPSAPHGDRTDVRTEAAIAAQLERSLPSSLSA